MLIDTSIFQRSYRSFERGISIVLQHKSQDAAGAGTQRTFPDDTDYASVDDRSTVCFTTSPHSLERSSKLRQDQRILLGLSRWGTEKHLARCDADETAHP